METTTLVEWLNSIGFDWKTGKIIVGVQYGNSEVREIANQDHPELNKSFSTNYGSPWVPSMIGSDKNGLYIMTMYDGAPGMQRIALGSKADISNFLNINVEIPYI